MQLAQQRIRQWFVRVQAAWAAGWRTVVRILLRRLQTLTPDNVDMLVAHLTLVPEDYEQ
jgi:hypothetical protein